ncbi:hypothetical protein U1Q18_042058 [Sarracenia purpurea var. burkii]
MRSSCIAGCRCQHPLQGNLSLCLWLRLVGGSASRRWRMSTPRNSRAIRAYRSLRTERKVRRRIEPINDCDGRRVGGTPGNIVEQEGVSHNFVLFEEIEQFVKGEMVIVGWFFIEAAISRREMAVSDSAEVAVDGELRCFHLVRFGT